MKKSQIFLTAFVVLSVFLAACTPTQAGSTTETPVNGTETGGDGLSTATSELSTSEATLPVSSTEMTTETPASSPQATTGANQTPAANQAEDPGLLTHEMKFQVLDQQNNVLGQVKDIVLDLTNLKVTYLVVELTQPSVSAPVMVAVPWDMLKVQAGATNMAADSTPSTTATASTGQANASQNAFAYTGDQQMLTSAPAFDPTSLPQLGQPAGDWDAAIKSYWSGAGGAAATPTLSATLQDTVTPTPANTTQQAVPLQGVALASKVIGFSIMDSSSQAAATLTDAVVDVNTGNLTYALVTVNNKLYAVPLSLLRMDMQNMALVIQATTQVLQGAPGFDLGSFPATTTSGWDAQIQSYWQTQVTPAATSQP